MSGWSPSTSDPEVEAVVAAFYAAFDNRGRTPTVDEVVAVFTEDATITRVDANGAATWTREEFARPRVELLTGGALTDFHEWETNSRLEIARDIASRWSRYAKEGTLDGADYRGGGTKLIQLRRQDGRWLISSVLWQDDD